MKKVLFIRADGNEKIGIGHVMRSMTIAAEFRRNGYECIYLSSDPAPTEILKKNGYDLIPIAYGYEEKSKEEAEEICRLVRERGADYILVDSYFAGNDYLSVLRTAAKVIVVSSVKQFLDTDYLINENIAVDREYLSGLYSGSGAKLLLGSEYSMIREEFVCREYSVAETVRTVLVTTGGGDYYNFMGGFLRRIKERKDLENIRFTFIVGNVNPHYPELLEESEHLENVTIIRNADNMSELMMGSDLAISAGGTTVLELAVIGVPTMAISVADDQKAGLSFMHDEGMLLYAGDIRDDSFWDRVILYFDELMTDPVKRKSISAKAGESVDGFGIKRIYQQITGDK